MSVLVVLELVVIRGSVGVPVAVGGGDSVDGDVFPVTVVGGGGGGATIEGLAEFSLQISAPRLRLVREAYRW